MYSEVVQGSKGLSQILNGINNKKTAKYISNLQREIAEMQFNYNKNKVFESTETNIRGTLKQYASTKENLYEQRQNIKMNLNFKNQMKGVDKENNSYMSDSSKKLDTEFSENLRNILENQKTDIINISKKGMEDIYQLQGSYNNTISNINQTEIQAKQQADQMVINGTMNIIEAIKSAYATSGAGEASPTVITESNGFFNNKMNFGKPYKFSRGYDKGNTLFSNLKLNGGF